MEKKLLTKTLLQESFEMGTSFTFQTKSLGLTISRSSTWITSISLLKVSLIASQSFQGIIWWSLKIY